MERGDVVGATKVPSDLPIKEKSTAPSSGFLFGGKKGEETGSRFDILGEMENFQPEKDQLKSLTERFHQVFFSSHEKGESSLSKKGKKTSLKVSKVVATKARPTKETT